MKRLLKLTSFLIIILIYNSTAQIGMGFFVGLSTPNDKVGDVYNNSTINVNNNNVVGNFVNNGVSSGYHFGAKARIPMSENVIFTGSASWNKFPTSHATLTLPPEIKDTTININISEIIIPISAGIQFYLFRSILSLYGVGELSYNYITSTVDYPTQVGPIPLKLNGTPTDNRVGFGLGAGLDIDVKVVLLNVEAKYNLANLIGQTSGEKSKAYYTLSLGIYFGNN